MKLKWTWLIGAIALLGVAWLLWIAAGNSQDCATMPVTEMDIGGHESLTMHIHQMLTITVNGEQILIPANIGLPNGMMRAIHTHDSSGKVHVEGTCPRDFTLGEFFDVWGQTFTEECIMEHCIDETHTLKMSVNGVETLMFRDTVLKDGDEIEIIYEEIT